MRVAFVSILNFPCAVEIGRNPRLRDAPLIVGDAETPKRVLDCSFSASEKRVRHGMAIRQAIAECPEAVVIPPDMVLYRTRWEAILNALGEITPEVEDEQMGRAYLNVGGLQYHYGEESDLCDRILKDIKTQTGLDAAIGLASGKFVAFAAGTMALLGESCVVRAGDEAAFLTELNVDLLPCEKETWLRLHLLGLDAIGDVAALTLPELQSQFGFEGKRLWQLANGIDEETLHPRRRVEQLADSLSFEAPVAGIDILVAGARQLFSRLEPSRRGRAVRELILQADLTSGRGWERHLVFREAVSESSRLVYLLRATLQNTPPPMAVQSLSLRLTGLTGETSKQLSLGEHGRLQRQLEESILQLKARYGYSPIYRCVEVDSWSVIPEDRQILVESDA